MGFVCHLFVMHEDVHPYILVPVILLPCVLPMIVSLVFKHCVRGGKSNVYNRSHIYPFILFLESHAVWFIRDNMDILLLTHFVHTIYKLQCPRILIIISD